MNKNPSKQTWRPQALKFIKKGALSYIVFKDFSLSLRNAFFQENLLMSAHEIHT